MFEVYLGVLVLFSLGYFSFFGYCCPIWILGKCSGSRVPGGTPNLYIFFNLRFACEKKYLISVFLRLLPSFNVIPFPSIFLQRIQLCSLWLNKPSLCMCTILFIDSLVSGHTVPKCNVQISLLYAPIFSGEV